MDERSDFTGFIIAVIVRYELKLDWVGLCVIVRIGIFLGLDPAEGGIYQYALTMLKALSQCTEAFAADDFIMFSSNPDGPLMDSLRSEGWRVVPLLPPTFKRRSLRLAERVVGRKPRQAVLRLINRLSSQSNHVDDLDTVRYNRELESWFRSNGIELMIYPISSSLSFETRIPYVLAVHDLQHRLQPQFPEVSANGEWEFREYLFRNAIRNATLLLAESETGKEDILTFYGEYGVTADQVKILPLLPAVTMDSEVSADTVESILRHYDLSGRYFFYPAQFWPHKNHVRIVQAVAHLKQTYGLIITVLFSGYHSGKIREATFKEVFDTAATLQIEDQIRYVGYVSDEHMVSLYKGARALIMPTFFGATNIPPLEAWALGCPVLTSDIRGIRQHAGEASILVNPRSMEDIAEGMHKLWTDDELCETLIAKGKQRIKLFTFADFRERVTEVIREAKSIVSGSGRQPNSLPN